MRLPGRGYRVWAVLPLASASGLAVISAVIVLSTLFLWWLLRSETREEGTEDGSDEGSGGEG